MSRKSGFTLVETLLAVGLSLMLVGILTQMARNFLFGFVWGEETLSAVREASVLLSALRKDLSRVALAPGGSRLAVQATTASAAIDLPTPSGTLRVEYRFDAAAGVLWRQSGGDPALGLGRGVIRKFQVSPVFLCLRQGQGVVLTDQLDLGETPWRAGLLVRLGVQGPDLSGTGGPARVLSFSTHVFPPFANRRLASVWRAL